MTEIFDQYRRSEKMVHRNVEISLNLRRVQNERQRAAGSGGFEQIGDQLGGNWNARLVFAVLARLAVIRQHGRDSPRGSAFESVNHQQKFQQVVVHRIMARLNDKNIGAAHIFQNLKIYLAIAEAAQHGFAQRNVQMLADGFCQHRVCSSRKDLKTLVVHEAISTLQKLQAEIPLRIQDLYLQTPDKLLWLKTLRINREAH